MKKSLLFQKPLAQMLEVWYGGLHCRALKFARMVASRYLKSSAALSFGFKHLNSGERFRAIMALLLSRANRSIALKVFK